MLTIIGIGIIGVCDRLYPRIIVEAAENVLVRNSIQLHHELDVLICGVAALWDVHRKPYKLSSGGPGSGLFKSVDGGDSWTEISRNKGLPQGMLGKIGATASGAQRDRIWAIVEAKEGGVFRSDDAGETWIKMNDQRFLRQRAWYYSRIYADPQSADTVYVLNSGFYRSDN